MTSLVERVYFASPIWIQQLGVGVYGWWWYHRRFGRLFERWVQQLNEHEHWSVDQFQVYQAEALGAILNSAHRSKYYQPLIVPPEQVRPTALLETLQSLPFLTKETLRSHAADLLTVTRLPRHTLRFKSSGTTGTPTEIYYTSNFHSFQMALHEARGYHWAGRTFRDRRMMFGVKKVCHFDQARPPFWRFSPTENLAYGSIYHLSPRFMPDYL